MSLPETFRAQASEQRSLANSLVGEADVLTNPTKLISAIVGHVNANTLEALAASLEYQRNATGKDSLATRRQAILERNDAIRNAAARGDWAEFERLVAGGSATAPTGT